MKRICRAGHRVGLMAAVLVTATSVAVGQATPTYYVDAAVGADVPSGGSRTRPWATIQYAIDQTVPVGYVTINVLPGVYTGPSSGPSAGSIVIDRDLHLEGLADPMNPGARAVIQPVGPGNPSLLITDRLNPITRATQVKNFRFQFGNPALEIRGTAFDPTLPTGPEIGFGVSPEVANNSFEDCQVGILVDTRNEFLPELENQENRPWIRYNTISPMQLVSLTYGIHVRSEIPGSPASNGPFVPLEPLIEANRIRLCEQGILIEEIVAQIDAVVRCDWIWNCEWGIRILGAADVDIVNETVADGMPFSSPLALIRGIHVVSPAAVVDIDNTILFIPNVGPAVGVDLDAPVPSNTTFDFSMSEDAFPITLGVMNILVPPTGPGFVPLANDYHLLPTSLAVDSGDTALVLPGTPDEIAYDNDGAPRLIDAFRDATLEVDRGGSEYTTVALDITTGVAPPIAATNATPPFVDVALGSTFDITVTSATADACFVIVDFANDAFNILPAPPYDLLGNQLVNQAASLFVPLTPDGVGTFTGLLTVTAPVAPAYAEYELDYQALLLSTGGTPGPGALSRRVRVEYNE